jgi:hypothetical protein
MTTEAPLNPLITRFASRLGESRTEVFRYDTERKISQVWDGAHWIDAIQARRSIGSETNMTKVAQETTDDC